MISRKLKFPMRRKFYAFRKTSTLSRSSHLLLYHSPSTSPKVSVVISKKVAKLATERNTLRRKILDRVLEIASGKSRDIIVFVKSKASLDVILLELNNFILP